MTEEEIVVPIVVPAYIEKDKKTTFFDKNMGKVKKWQEHKKKKRAGKRKKTVLSQTPTILPFLEVFEDSILMKEGVMEIFQITSKDLHSLNDNDLHFSMLVESRFLRSYYPAFKEVAMNFPSNMEKQRNYWLKKKEKTTDPIRLRFIERKLFEFKFLEEERTNCEFFLFIYAESKAQLEERKKQAIRSRLQSFPLKPLSIEKKMDVLFILNNQNSKL